MFLFNLKKVYEKKISLLILDIKMDIERAILDLVLLCNNNH